MLDLRTVVNAINRDDPERHYNLLADYARANGATFRQPTGEWVMPPTGGSTANTAHSCEFCTDVHVPPAPQGVGP
jgi:hypothetical protein